MPLTKPKAAQVDFDVTNITDPLIRLNSGESGSADKDTGFVLERGSDTNVGLIWDESADQFAFINTSETGTTSGDVTIASYANVKADEFHGDGSNLSGIHKSLAINSTTTISSANMAECHHLFCHLSCSVGNTYTVTLPAVGNFTNKLISFVVTSASGESSVTINKSDGNNLTDNTGGAVTGIGSLNDWITVYSDGTNYTVMGYYGTAAGGGL